MRLEKLAKAVSMSPLLVESLSLQTYIPSYPQVTEEEVLAFLEDKEPPGHTEPLTVYRKFRKCSRRFLEKRFLMKIWL